MRTTRLAWPGFIVFSLLVTAVFSQRVYQLVQIGESHPAVVELLPPLLVLLAAAVTVHGRGRNLAILRTRGFLLLWGPYLILTLILPVLGVVGGEYPLRGLASVRTPLVAVSAILLGAEIRRCDRRGLAAWSWALLVAALIVAGYALLQQLIVAHLLPRGPWDQLQAWDLTSQEAYGTGLVLGRNGAFYTNPSILGAWAGIAMLIAVVALQGWRRYTVLGATLLSLLLSQSRGATLGLLAAFAFLLVPALTHRRAVRPRALIPALGAVAAVIALWAVLAAARAPVSALPDRLISGFGYVLGGQDPNAAGRLAFWKAGLDLLRTHPFGTLGPPEVLMGTAVDSEWIRALLQGGPILLVALGTALLGATLSGRPGPERRTVRGISVFIAVAGLTQIPLEYPPALLYWAMVGALLAVPNEPGAGTAKDVRHRDDAMPPPAGAGGQRLLMVTTIARTLEAFLLPYAPALAERRWTVDAMAHGIASNRAVDRAFVRTWEIGWTRRPLSVANLKAVGRVRAVAAAGRYDIVHVHTPVAAFVTRFALRREPGRPVVIYTAHGFHFHPQAGWIRNLVYGSLERLAGRWTDELVVVNHDDYEAAIQAGLAPPNRIHQIPGAGFDPGYYDASKISPAAIAAARLDAGVPPDRPMVVAVAELNRNKNLGFLLAGLVRVEEGSPHLVIVGDGPERDALATFARRLKIDERVHILGRVADVRPLVAGASAFALVSRREGLPNSMIEAMSMGIPVIGTDTRGIRDLAGQGRGILVPLEDVDALSRAIRQAITNSTWAADAAERARTFVRTQLSLERVLAQYLALYDAAAARRARRATA